MRILLENSSESDHDSDHTNNYESESPTSPLYSSISDTSFSSSPSGTFYSDDDEGEESDEEEEEEEEEPDEEEGNQSLEEVDVSVLKTFLNDKLHQLGEEPQMEYPELDLIPGCRFCPSDYILIVHYLINKVLNYPLPCDWVEDAEELYNHNPELIAEQYGNREEKAWYFFTSRKQKYQNGKRPNRVAGNGYWKAMGADKAIKSKEIVIGHKRKLVFYEGEPSSGDKTNWIMHEYRIDHPITENDMRLDKWVLCRLYQRNERS